MENSGGTVLVTGANRGLGYEFARQYAEEGWRVIACCRHPDRATSLAALSDAHDVQVHALDVTDQSQIDGLKSALGGAPIDILLSNASHLGMVQTQTFGQADYDEFVTSYEVNALGPFRLANAFFPEVAASRDKKMMFMGTVAGSTGLLRPPVDLFAYASAKAALHSMVRGLHLNLAPKGITVGLLEPGMTDTQGFMTLPEGEPAPHGLERVMDLIRNQGVVLAKPEDSVMGLRKLIDGMTPEQAGRLVHISGEILSW